MIKNLKTFGFVVIFLFPLIAAAQQADSIRLKKDSLKTSIDTVERVKTNGKSTLVTGQIIDDATGKPLSMISIQFSGTKYSTESDSLGRYTLSAPEAFIKLTFSYVGFITVTRNVKAGQQNTLNIRLKSSNKQLKSVQIVASKNKRYRNKGNPAVELIQQVINHKAENRMENGNYLQFDQYERIGLSFFDIPAKLTQSKLFSPYRFMLDSGVVINGQNKTTLPVFFSEKLFQNYYRKNPSKTIRILQAQKETNIIKFIDTAGTAIYLNRLYGNNFDIYDNNIFIINNQFLSPIADHAPDFYKFFISDTVQTSAGKLVVISFTPRNQGDLLFEGKLLVTLDGHYAVAQCELQVNKHINVNFMRTLKINLDFVQNTGGRYYLIESQVKADFGVLKDKGLGVYGERTVFYNNYQFDKPLAEDFYRGKDLQTAAAFNITDTVYWATHRTDTLTKQQARVYTHMNKLQNMGSYKRASWIASTITGNFADVGPVQIGPLGATYTYSSFEASRFQIGARTTPKFNRSFYLDGYTAYGTGDRKQKYNIAGYFSFNKTAPYRYPNDYFKVSYLNDIAIPGQNFLINRASVVLSSFQSSQNDYFLYSKIFKAEYTNEFENHLSYTFGFKNWNQQAAGTLVYRFNDLNNTLINTLTTSEVELGFRYAPHEQIIQGTEERHTIYSKYPIINVQINHGFKDVLNGSYDYTNLGTNIFKRFYLSQLGYANVTLMGNMLIGKLPFPLLNISPANQSIAYDPDAYNQMHYLEFVSDHYVGLNITQHFEGFFLNKVPLVDHLKWREILTLKVLYGGLRTENDPAFTSGLYQFPTGSDGLVHTYALGSTPYIEAGAGIGNIFKFLRLDLIRRFNYLDHPGISRYGLKFGINIDL